MVWMNFGHLFLQGLHNSYIHLSIFSTFSVIIPWQHDMSGHRSGYELLGPWPMCPGRFIEISCNLGQKSALSYYNTEEDVKKNNNSVHPNQTTTESHPLMGDGIMKQFILSKPFFYMIHFNIPIVVIVAVRKCKLRTMLLMTMIKLNRIVFILNYANTAWINFPVAWLHLGGNYLWQVKCQ